MATHTIRASLIFGATFALYLATLTQVHTFDALSYVLDVDRKPWQELFHPHHLAYGPLGAFARDFAHAAGYTGSAVLPLQIINACAGALGVTLFFATLHRLTGRADLSLGGAVLLGASYAYWYYAVEVEVYTIAALFLVLCLRLMAALVERPTAGRWAALGLAQGAAVLFHQTNALLCAPIALLALWPRMQNSEQRIANSDRSMFAVRCSLFFYGVPLALVVGGSYLWVGFGVSGLRGWAQLAAWMTEYARTGWWGGAITGGRWADLAEGLAGTLAQPGGGWLGLLLLALLLGHLPPLAVVHRRLAVCLAAWLLVYGGFFLWWEPDNVEFWIASLPPFLALLALALHAGRAPRPAAALLLSTGLVALGLNYAAIARRGDASLDLQRTVARTLAAASSPGDLLLVPDGLQELYLPYYEGRSHVLSLNRALFASGGSWPLACRAVRAQIDETLASGFALVIGAEVMAPAPASAADAPTIIERFGLTAAEVSGCFAPYRADLARLAMPAGLPVYYRMPAAQELADGRGWQFQGSTLGWQAQHVAAAKAAAAGPGWTVAPGVDPALLSPPVRIDTARYRAVEIRMAASTAARDGQLFFRDEQGQVDEARAVRWMLQPGDEAVTYRIELRDAPGWHGVVTGLRLDPVSAGDGGWVRLESVRLVP